MSLCHVWSCHPIQTASHIHIRYMNSVWAISMLYQGHMGAPLYHSSGQEVGPRFGDFVLLWEWKWYQYIMFKAVIHLRLLPVSIIDIYKVFEPLSCWFKGIWMHPHTVPAAKLAPDLGILGRLWIGYDAITSCSRLLSYSNCFLHPF